MGLFGGPVKQEPVNPTPFDGETFEEPYDSLPTLPKAHNNTIIAKGITFTGVIRGEGAVQVEGRLEGEIDLKGSVTVATTGLIQGPVPADIVRVAEMCRAALPPGSTCAWSGRAASTAMWPPPLW